MAEPKRVCVDMSKGPPADMKKRRLKNVLFQMVPDLGATKMKPHQLGESLEKSADWDNDPVFVAVKKLEENYPAAFDAARAWIAGLGELAAKCVVKDLLMCMLLFAPADQLCVLMNEILNMFIKSNVLMQDYDKGRLQLRAYVRQRDGRFARISELFEESDKVSPGMAALWSAIFDYHCFPDSTRYTVLVEVGKNLAALRAAPSAALDASTRALMSSLFPDNVVMDDDNIDELFVAAMKGDDDVVDSSKLCDLSLATVVFEDLADEEELPACMLVM